MSEQYSIAQARDRFTRIVQQAESGETVSITRRGKPVAVVLSVDAYQNLASSRARFGENLEVFRDSYDIEGLELDVDSIFDVRDKDTGREVNI